MRNYSFVLTMILTLLVISSSALAISDIQLRIADAAGNEKGIDVNPVSTCPGPITVQDVKIYVKNFGSSSDTFSVSMTLPQGWDGAIQSGVTLGSGEEKQLNLFYVNIPYNTAPNKYYITIKAQSNTNPADFVTKEVVVEILGCHVVELNVVDTFREGCQESAQSYVYRIDVTNKGKWEEEYALSSPVSWAVFKTTNVKLSSQETKQVELVVTPPATLSGEQKIGINAQSVASYASDTDEVKVILTNCYDFAAGITPLENSVCVGKSKPFTITIENKGSEEDTYMLAAPDWIELSEAEVTIPAGQARQVVAVATPANSGRTNFDVTISSKTEASAKKIVTGGVVADECRGVAVIVSPTEVTACQGAEVKLNVAVKNTGTVEDTFTLEASAGALGDSSLTLGPGETKSTTITIDTGKTQLNGSVNVKVSDGFVSDQSAATVALEDCYSSKVTVTADRQTACPCGTVVLTVALQNTGKLADKYTVKLDNESKTADLASGASETITFEKAVACDKSGNVSFIVGVTSEQTGITAHAVELGVIPKDQCYSVHLLTAGTLESVEGGKATAIKLTLANDGEEADVYAIEVSGPAWSYVSPATTTVGSKSSEDMYLYVSPPFGLAESDNEIKVTARSQMSASEVSFMVHVGGSGQVTVQNITQEQPGQPNVTIERPGEVTLNVSFNNITGQFTEAEERPFWKTLTVAVITLVIIIILIVRFAFLFKK